MRIKLISNPNSGHNRKNPKHIEKLSKILGDHVLLPPLEKLEETILQLQKEGLDVLTIAGGDGTVHQVLSAVHRAYRDKKWPKIALLPSGTMNNVARNVGVQKKSIPQLRKIMETIKEGSPLQTSTFCPLIFDEEKAGFIFGQGGVSEVLKEYEKGGNTSQLKAILLIMKTVGSAFVNGSFVRKLFAPVAMEVHADGEIQKHKTYTVSVLSSISDIGFGFRPCYATHNDPSIAQFIGFTQHPIITALCLPKIRLALPIKNTSVQDVCAKSFVLISKKPMLYTIDGDLYVCEKKLTIRVGEPVQFVI